MLRPLLGSAGVLPRILFAGSTVMLLLAGPICLFVASQVHHTRPRNRRGPPDSMVEAVLSLSSIGSLQAPPPAPPAPPAGTPAADLPALKTTIASWYRGRPNFCYQDGKPVSLPPGILSWTASKTLPCGARVEVSGPAGRAVVQVEDRGPYMGGRDLDLSPDAFRRIVGALVIGTARVTYRVLSPK